MAFNFLFVESQFNALEIGRHRRGHAGRRSRRGATPVWTASNHDVGRFPTRWCHDDERAASERRLSLLATLPGTLVLYYGDELGMADVDVPVALAARRDEPGPAGLARAATGPRHRCLGQAIRTPALPQPFGPAVATHSVTIPTVNVKKRARGPGVGAQLLARTCPSLRAPGRWARPARWSGSCSMNRSGPSG